MKIRVHLLEVEKEPIEIGQGWLDKRSGNLAAGLHCCMNKCIVTTFQDGSGEFGLKKGFSASEGDPSPASPVLPVALNQEIEAIHRHGIPSLLQCTGAACSDAIKRIAGNTFRAVDNEISRFLSDGLMKTCFNA